MGAVLHQQIGRRVSKNSKNLGFYLANMPRVAPRDVPPILQKIRAFLLGREHTHAIRFPRDLASLSPPLPTVPLGVSHKLSANYYYTRDGRRAITPDETVAVVSPSGVQLISAGEGEEEEESAIVVATKTHKTPGANYNP